ncbi:hypothetical protein MGAS11027_1248 [Streptococcus pyogenes]|nr:hypothetical protein MGAS11027_1248 [Streptococcus pyogenes]ANC25833.1 hypothetical protein MGAS23530_1157 [Streptococcus pyogenes]ANC27462.1 hypothetical protein MGAS27061_1192 [Streptococcus pyogenes]ASO98326.1 hypothetical protein CFA72_03415 [Streptococcus pyogenes]BAV55457.1 hypothetical protein JMUB1235_1202 [Streptococcus pyogenes]
MKPNNPCLDNLDRDEFRVTISAVPPLFQTIKWVCYFSYLISDPQLLALTSVRISQHHRSL